MWGVESTRAPSIPRKSMVTSVVTRIFCSPRVPTGMSFMGRSGSGQAGEHTPHVAEGAVDAGHRVLVVDLVLEVDAALVVHLLQLFEDRRERHLAIAGVALAVLLREVTQ